MLGKIPMLAVLPSASFAANNHINKTFLLYNKVQLIDVNKNSSILFDVN